MSSGRRSRENGHRRADPASSGDEEELPARGWEHEPPLRAAELDDGADVRVEPARDLADALHRDRGRGPRRGRERIAALEAHPVDLDADRDELARAVAGPREERLEREGREIVRLRLGRGDARARPRRELAPPEIELTIEREPSGDGADTFEHAWSSRGVPRRSNLR